MQHSAPNIKPQFFLFRSSQPKAMPPRILLSTPLPSQCTLLPHQPESGPTPPRSRPMRTDLSTGWTFERIRANRGWLSTATAHGPVVDLPHTWNELDTFQEGVNYYQGWGSYRRVFDPPPIHDAAARQHLCSEGFYGAGEIWLNGRRVAAVDGQYLGFRVDITEFLFAGQANCLGIRLNNKYSRGVLPGIRTPDFLLHGGLAGRVWIETLPATHFARDHFMAHGHWDAAVGGTLHCVFTVTNNKEVPIRASAHATLRDASGKTLASGTIDLEAPARSTSPKQPLEIPVPSALPWSPETPNIHTLTVALLAGGETLDSVTRRIGFRNAEFRPGAGFFINGTRVHLHGCNRHESMPGFGQALPESLHKEDAAGIRRLGLNFVRLSHYPQNPAFLDACDELGILVYAEIATWKSVRGYGRWLRAACRQMRSMILRDNHHPSVILWGMGNEERSPRAFRKLREIAKELDPDRPTIYAENHLHRAVRRRTTGMPDVWGSNYELNLLSEGAAASRLKVAIVSEMSNYPPGRRGERERELEQVATIESDLKSMGSPAHVAGFALWCWNDYATLRKQRYFRHCGIVDAWRIPKPAAWLMEALYARQPVIRLYGDWSCRNSSADREIHIFTNCAAVTLMLQGQPVMELRGAPHIAVRLPYTPSPLVAAAGSGAGTVEAVLQPHDAARSFTIVPERLQASASGRDTVGFMLRVEDSEANIAADWSGTIPVVVDGPARLRAYTPKNEVLVNGGTGRGFVTATGASGTVTISASHPALGAAATNLSLAP